MKHSLATFIVTISTIVAIVFGYVIFEISSTKNNTSIVLQRQIEVLKKQEEACVFTDNRIKTMQKTLMVAYGLSRWEAHYYAIIFNDFSVNYQIPWEIYPAIVRIESNFKGTLVSNKGAKGMMQLLEPTAKMTAAELDIEYTEGQTIWNDLLNIVFGCQYLSKNIKQLGLEGGVKSYLGGINYVKVIKANEEANRYVAEYKTTVWKEYKQLVYVYRGILGEQGLSCEQLDSSAYTDSIKIKLDLFDFSK